VPLQAETRLLCPGRHAAGVKRAVLDSWPGLDYIVDKAPPSGREQEDAMLNLFTGLEANLALELAVLAFGCAIFVGVILCSRCPNCSWLEWVSEKLGNEKPGSDGED
jgi:hypothetical protein